MSLQKQLNFIQNNGGVLTFKFEDGTFQKQNINKFIFYNERGLKRKYDDIIKIFDDIRHDLGAISFEF